MSSQEGIDWPSRIEQHFHGLPAAILGPVEPGSIVLLDSSVVPFAAGDQEEDTWTADLVRQLADRVGHDRFLVVCIPFVRGEPPVQVYGPDDLKALLGLAEAPA